MLLDLLYAFLDTFKEPAMESYVPTRTPHLFDQRIAEAFCGAKVRQVSFEEAFRLAEATISEIRNATHLRRFECLLQSTGFRDHYVTLHAHYAAPLKDLSEKFSPIRTAVA